MSGNILLSSTGRFDLRSVQFSRRGAFLCVLEDDQDRSLYLSLSRSPNMWMQRKNLVRLVPVIDNKEIPWEYEVEPEKMTIRTCRGNIVLCFDRNGCLRVAGKGVSLRCEFKMMLFENACPRENGDWEIDSMILGKLLFVPLKGALYCSGGWNNTLSRSDDFILELIPSVENRIFEAAIHEYRANGNRYGYYEPMDAVAEDARTDFERFCGRFLPTMPEHAGMAKLSAWVIWMHTLGPGGLLKNEVVYMTRTQWLRAFGWQQSFHAMAAGADLKAAWQLLLTIFDYQNEAGKIPDGVSDLGAAYIVSKPALQGFALDVLLSEHSLDEIPDAEVRALYDCLSRFADWWLICRDRNKCGVPQYYHGSESPGEYCTIFRDGVPLLSPDLIAFVALLTDRCGDLAEYLGEHEAKQKWQETSERLICRLLSEFWNGERFVAKLAETDREVDSECFMCLLPILLGKRLPEDVRSQLSAQIRDEEMYMSPGGVLIESARQKKRMDVSSPGPSGSPAYVNTLIAMGLWQAGEKELAAEIARRSVSIIGQTGLGFIDKVPEKAKEDKRTLYPRKREPETVSRWSSWTGACFIILSNILYREQNEK